METSTAGRFRSDGSETSSPVRGFMVDGKSSRSGPYEMGESRVCGVGVNVGINVDVDVGVLSGKAVSVAVSEIAGRLAHAARIIRASNTMERRIDQL
jgi:hypothetical protein